MASEVVFIPNLLVGLQWERALTTRALIAGLGEGVANRAKQLAPVRTGALRDSIHMEMGTLGGAAEAQIIADVPYAAYVEVGTSDTSPAPYLRPALDSLGSG